MTVKARIAVIGCGHWAVEAHLPALASDERAQIVALVDPNRENLAYASQRWHADTLFSDVSEMLEATAPDGVVVAVPAALHADITILALEAGAHVLVEKPMVIGSRDARRIMDVSSRRQREVIVGHPWHFNSQALEIRERLRAQALGDLRLVTCLFASDVLAFYAGDTETARSDEGYDVAPQRDTYSDPRVAGGGQGQTQLCHAFALLHFVTEARVQRVSGFTDSLDVAVDVIDGALATLDSGAIATFASTGAIPRGSEPLFEYRVFGDRGHLTWNVRMGAASVTIDGHIEHLATPAETYPAWAPVRNLVDVVLGVAANGSPAALGLHTAEFLDAMYDSAAHAGAPRETNPGA